MTPFTGNNTAQCCCHGCPFWKDGCTAEKPLACKTWLCHLAKLNADRGVNEKLNVIAEKAQQLRLYVVRGDKKQSIDHALRMVGIGRYSGEYQISESLATSNRKRIEACLLDSKFFTLD